MPEIGSLFLRIIDSRCAPMKILNLAYFTSSKIWTELIGRVFREMTELSCFLNGFLETSNTSKDSYTFFIL